MTPDADGRSGTGISAMQTSAEFIAGSSRSTGQATGGSDDCAGAGTALVIDIRDANIKPAAIRCGTSTTPPIAF